MSNYKVMARVEETEPAKLNGETKYRWVCVSHSVPRGTAEAIALRTTERGFRLDAERGSTYYPQNRIALVEVVSNELEVT